MFSRSILATDSSQTRSLLFSAPPKENHFEARSSPMSSSKPPRLGPLLARLALLSFSILFAFFVGEVGLRLLGYRGVAKSALERDFAPAFTVDLAYKDLRLAMELADDLDMPLLLGPQAHNVMRMARSKDQGGENVTAIMKVYEEIMDQQVGPAGKNR